MNQSNIYEPIRCTVDGVIEESPAIKTIVLIPEKQFSFEAGQFISMTVPDVGEAPFTPSSSPFKTEKIEVTVMKTGLVTGAIHALKKGDVVGIRGPYGKPYPLENFAGKEVLLVGGGVGLAPLRSLFFSLLHTINAYEKITFCCGAKTPADYIYKNQILDEWLRYSEKMPVSFRITVDKKDEGWNFMEGLVTTTLDNLDIKISNSVAVVCGPPVMMRFTTLKLLDLGYSDSDIYLSMERKMYCAVGHCRHCLIGPYFVCKDGPVFTYNAIRNEPSVWA
ncbi:MAG TPA: FAD/NAD(P)-binding protein [Candidatus Ratteibacteria bacterium]|jgi:NAD(P)H-flavin reductase|uniref:Anaerobic sulfite reductase subunit B n=1 Tax=candidate division TA06 bacterium ADurb.Bin131 TaxID=1852827 RepID=A0A1V6C4Z0_UNCT6|nr:MAG: Anaerobic sulfite reductase subunit B [candidate division TA06 bacterium ADurb.Bin131]HOC02310.1 FAD/NAD(P)-binding protein [bacterium]HRS05748.1 FAD/NAD(P)-binding protein [Candidatus Ratteibacteria bacterium]HON04818.1 FAD/NAD(P)-binding protein [bacterium]HPC29850.1 FAD/NAD(P)-binding protein [bacterium]